MLKIFVGYVTVLSACVCMAESLADKTKEQAARKVLLESIRNHTEPPDGYLGARGQASFATHYHAGNMDQALKQAQRVLSKRERARLDWSGYRGTVDGFKTWREDLLFPEDKLLDNLFSPVREEYRGTEGFWKFIEEFLYDIKSAEDRRAAASGIFRQTMTFLSPSEQKQLGWHFHEIFGKPKTEQSEASTPEQTSSPRPLRTRVSGAVSQALKLHPPQGGLNLRGRVSEAASKAGAFVKNTTRGAGQSVTHRAGQVKGMARGVTHRMGDIPDTVKIAVGQALTHLPETLTETTKATAHKVGQVAQSASQAAGQAVRQTPEKLKQVARHTRQGATKVRGTAQAGLHQTSHRMGEVLQARVFKNKPQTGEDGEVTANNYEEGKGLTNLVRQTVQNQAGNLKQAYEHSRGVLFPKKKSAAEVLASELAGENHPARLYEKGEQALENKEYDKAGLFFAKALVVSAPTTKFQSNVIDWMQKSNRYHGNPLQINEEERAGLPPADIKDPTGGTDRFIHIVYLLGVLRGMYSEPFLTAFYPSQNHLKDAAFHYHPLAQYEEGRRHYKAGNFSHAFYWFHTMLSHSLTNPFIDEGEWEKKAAQAAYLVGQMYLNPLKHHFPLKTAGENARLTEQNRYWGGEQKDILNEVKKTFTFWQALDRRNHAWALRKAKGNPGNITSVMDQQEKHKKPEVFWAKPNPIQGWEWMRWAAARNHSLAQYDLYQMYTREGQEDIGLQWLNRAATRGHLLARYEKALRDYQDKNFDSAYQKLNLLTTAYTQLRENQDNFPLSPEARSLETVHVAHAFYLMGSMVNENQVPLQVMEQAGHSEWHDEVEKYLDEVEALRAGRAKATQTEAAPMTLAEEKNQLRRGVAIFLYEKARSLGSQEAKNQLVAMSIQWNNLKEAYSGSEQAKHLAALSLKNQVPGTFLDTVTDQTKRAGHKAREMVTGAAHKTGQVVTDGAQLIRTHSARTLQVGTEAVRHPGKALAGVGQGAAGVLKDTALSAKQKVTGAALTVQQKTFSTVGTVTQSLTQKAKTFSERAGRGGEDTSSTEPTAEPTSGKSETTQTSSLPTQVSSKQDTTTRDPTLDKVWGMEVASVTSDKESDSDSTAKVQGMSAGLRAKMMDKCSSTFARLRQRGHKGWNQARKILPSSRSETE